jgi:hypothetical protein
MLKLKLNSKGSLFGAKDERWGPYDDLRPSYDEDFQKAVAHAEKQFGFSFGSAKYSASSLPGTSGIQNAKLDEGTFMFIPLVQYTGYDITGTLFDIEINQYARAYQLTFIPTSRMEYGGTCNGTTRPMSTPMTKDHDLIVYTIIDLGSYILFCCPNEPQKFTYDSAYGIQTGSYTADVEIIGHDQKLKMEMRNENTYSFFSREITAEGTIRF